MVGDEFSCYAPPLRFGDRTAIVHPVSVLFGPTFTRVDLPEPMCTATCSTFVHANKMLSELRARNPIQSGDLDLTMRMLRREDSGSLLDFAASCVSDDLRHEKRKTMNITLAECTSLWGYDSEEELLEPSWLPRKMTPANVFWEFSHFGYMERGRFDVPPETTAADVDQLKGPEVDLLLIRQLCEAHGTLGDAVLPDAFSPIEEMLLVISDGNTHDVYYQTATHHSHFYFITS